jgi:ankyrin repeat protein
MSLTLSSLVPNPRRSEVYEHSRLASILLEQTANVDIRNRNGLTALMFACQQGHTVIVQELLMQKVNDLLINACKNGHYRRLGFNCEYLLNANCEVFKSSQSIDSQE